MTYANASLLSFADLCDAIARYAWGVKHLPASVDRDDWAQEARLAAWSLTVCGSVPVEFSSVLRAANDAIRHHCHDAVSHSHGSPIEEMPEGERAEFATVASAEDEVIAHETFYAISRKKRNRNGVPSCRFRREGAPQCAS